MTVKAIERKRDIGELMDACNKSKPKESDIAELRAMLEENPGIAMRVEMARQNLMQMASTRTGARTVETLTMNEVKTKRAALGYEAAPMLERMLIDTLLMAWLRYQRFENLYTQLDQGGDGITLTKAAFWDKRVTQARAGYLKACETLAKVRKLTSPVLQVNVAQEGSQQVNVAGDLVK